MGPLAQSKSDQLTRYHQLKIRRQLDHGWNRNQILRLTAVVGVHATIIFISDATIISNSNATLIDYNAFMLIGTDEREK